MKYLKNFESLKRPVLNPDEIKAWNDTINKDYEKYSRKYTKSGYQIYDEDYYTQVSKDKDSTVDYLGYVLCVNKEKKWLTIGKKYKLFEQNLNGYLWIIDDRNNLIDVQTKNNIDFFDVDLQWGRLIEKNTAHLTRDNTIEEYELRATATKYNL